MSTTAKKILLLGVAVLFITSQQVQAHDLNADSVDSGSIAQAQIGTQLTESNEHPVYAKVKDGASAKVFPSSAITTTTTTTPANTIAEASEKNIHHENGIVIEKVPQDISPMIKIPVINGVATPIDLSKSTASGQQLGGSTNKVGAEDGDGDGDVGVIATAVEGGGGGGQKENIVFFEMDHQVPSLTELQATYPNDKRTVFSYGSRHDVAVAGDQEKEKKQQQLMSSFSGSHNRLDKSAKDLDRGASTISSFELQPKEVPVADKGDDSIVLKPSSQQVSHDENEPQDSSRHELQMNGLIAPVALAIDDILGQAREYKQQQEPLQPQEQQQEEQEVMKEDNKDIQQKNLLPPLAQGQPGAEDKNTLAQNPEGHAVVANGLNRNHGVVDTEQNKIDHSASLPLPIEHDTMSFPRLSSGSKTQSSQLNAESRGDHTKSQILGYLHHHHQHISPGGKDDQAQQSSRDQSPSPQGQSSIQQQYQKHQQQQTFMQDNSAIVDPSLKDVMAVDKHPYILAAMTGQQQQKPLQEQQVEAQDIKNTMRHSTPVDDDGQVVAGWVKQDQAQTGAPTMGDAAQQGQDQIQEQDPAAPAPVPASASASAPAAVPVVLDQVLAQLFEGVNNKDVDDNVGNITIPEDNNDEEDEEENTDLNNADNPKPAPPSLPTIPGPLASRGLVPSVQGAHHCTPQFCVNVTLSPDAKFATFHIERPLKETGWIALGIGYAMTMADLLILWPNPTPLNGGGPRGAILSRRTSHAYVEPHLVGRSGHDALGDNAAEAQLYPAGEYVLHNSNPGASVEGVKVFPDNDRFVVQLTRPVRIKNSAFKLTPGEEQDFCWAYSPKPVSPDTVADPAAHITQHQSVGSFAMDVGANQPQLKQAMAQQKLENDRLDAEEKRQKKKEQEAAIKKYQEEAASNGKKGKYSAKHSSDDDKSKTSEAVAWLTQWNGPSSFSLSSSSSSSWLLQGFSWLVTLALMFLFR
ncbi:hypothetical protein EDD11_002298 [Mortierella claussenii]|nr:hypothetical protein EDD11_002298 [Mortierella claussenii]